MWVYWILSLAAMGVSAYSVARWRTRPIVVRVPAPNVAHVIVWPGFDLDAVQAAGERASMAVRADQATRAPRSQRVRHLSVVA